MRFTEEQRKEFEAAARPLIKFMNENCHPHTTTFVDSTRAELSEGVCAFVARDCIKD